MSRIAMIGGDGRPCGHARGGGRAHRDEALRHPDGVDGGLASDTVAAIMQRVGEGVDALYRINGTLGEIVRAIADDAETNEQDVIDQLDPVAAIVEDL
ncbi:hypothetical protein CTI14_22650 [Methylobacterium radiotolerans]|nr:hypothetical protein CTI14_22650 [Methylobacterium radiotolerans]